MEQYAATPEFVQYYEQIIASRLANGDTTLENEYHKFEADYLQWRSKHRELTSRQATFYTEHAWLLWIDKKANALAQNHPDADFFALQLLATKHKLPLRTLVDISVTLHIPVIPLFPSNDLLRKRLFIFCNHVARLERTLLLERKEDAST